MKFFFGGEKFPGNFKEYTLIKSTEVKIQLEETLNSFNVSICYSLSYQFN